MLPLCIHGLPGGGSPDDAVPAVAEGAFEGVFGLSLGSALGGGAAALWSPCLTVGMPEAQFGLPTSSSPLPPW
ncbi:hypothetical protein ASF25_17480 [Methylobacterium sp. Leaf100]|nr:hypothetical protein ASF25_17480 [Methylobacterium sp. Leaf100]